MDFKFKLRQSKLFSLNTLDFIKSLIITIVAEVLYNTEVLLVNYNIDPTLKFTIAIIAAYLLKNFFTPGPKSTTDVNISDVTASPDPDDIGIPKPRP